MDIGIGFYAAFMLFGLIGHMMVNDKDAASDNVLRIGNFLPLCFGQFVGDVNKRSNWWYCKEYLIIFPILGLINVLLTIYYMFRSLKPGYIDMLNSKKLNLNKHQRVMLNGVGE